MTNFAASNILFCDATSKGIKQGMGEKKTSHFLDLSVNFSKGDTFKVSINPSTPTVAICSLTLSSEHHSAQMSKFTNDGLTRSGSGCFIAVPIRQQWALKC